MAAFFENEGLSAIGAEFLVQRSHSAIYLVALHVAGLENVGDGIRDGLDEMLLHELGILAANTLELLHDLADLDAGAQSQ